jgi:tetratricopeptide (TPR) repeat protein
MTRRKWSAAAFGIFMLMQGSLAYADPAAAEALFREGRALLERGELAPACEKLEASNALDPSSGTLLNLAACRLRQGRTATSWAHFLSAQRLAENQMRTEQASEAKRRALELEPRLSTLTLLAPEAPAGLEVRRNGQIVQLASLGTAVPVDPGQVVIEVSAPGYQSERLELTLGEAADRRVLKIPTLRQAIARGLVAPSASTSPDAARRDGPARARSSALPWVIGGAGAGALLAGSVFGVLALSSNSTAEEQCNAGKSLECDETEQRRNGQALASSVGFGVGLVGVGVAAIWLLADGSGRPRSAWSYDGEVTRQSALFKMRVGF